MIVSAIIIVAHTATGGFITASIDLVRSIVMTVALICIVCFGIGEADGIGNVGDYAASMDGYLSMTHMNDAATNSASPTAASCPPSAPPLGVWATSECSHPAPVHGHQPEKDQKLSRRIATIWVFYRYGGDVTIGYHRPDHGSRGRYPAVTDPGRRIICSHPAQFMAQFGIVPALFSRSGVMAGICGTCHVHLRQPAAGRLLLHL